MNGFVVELPAESQAKVARRGVWEPSEESAWAAEAVREKLAACAELEYLEARVARRVAVVGLPTTVLFRVLLGQRTSGIVAEMNYWQRTARRRGFDELGHVHELNFACFQRYRFLVAGRTCQWLADAIGEARERHGFDLWAYVFMPDHAHLILRPHALGTTVAAILKGIKQPVGRRALLYLEAHAPRWLPRLTRRRGGRVELVFWQSGGGYDRNIIEPRTLMAMIDYVHANPVRRGLVERVGDWHWSSAGWYDGEPRNELRPDPIPPEWCIT